MRPEPTRDQICAAIKRHAAERRATLAELSRMLGHRDGYLWRFVNVGIPNRLAPRDRALLAAFFTVDEYELGARPGERRWRPPHHELRERLNRRR